MAAAYTIYRIPNTARSYTSSFKTLYGVKPDLSHFRVFGSTGYLRVASCKRTKWDSKANKYIFSWVFGYVKGIPCVESGE